MAAPRPTALVHFLLSLCVPLGRADGETLASAWISSLVSKAWRPVTRPGARETGLQFRWGDGEQRDERWAFIDLEHRGARADGTISITEVDPADAQLQLVIREASYSLARSTFLQLVEALPDARGFMAEGTVGTSSELGLGQGGATELGLLTVLPGDFTRPGPYRAACRLGSRTLIEAYGPDDSDQPGRLRAVEAWVRQPSAPQRPAESAAEHSSVEAAPVAPPVVSPSYLLGPVAPPAPSSPAGVDATADPFPLSLTEPIHRDLIRASLARDAVPFAGSTSPARLAELRKEAVESDETAFHPVRAAAQPDGDSTMMLPLAAMLGQAATPAFASSLGATPIPELTVDRYAALSAELEVKGSTPEVLRRYNLPTPGALRALQDEQARRMTSDPALKARFEERVAHFLRFLRPMETP